MATGAFNIPLMSIPAYYALAILPHGYAVAKSMKGDRKTHNNANPHGNRQNESLKKRLTAQELAQFERAEACHRNHLENMPLFVATIFAGLLAEQRAGIGAVGLDQFVMAWMVVRVIYTVNYIAVESRNWSYLRSLLYFIGTGWAFSVLAKSAYVFGK